MVCANVQFILFLSIPEDLWEKISQTCCMSKFSVGILKHSPTDIPASAATSNTGNHRSECTEELIQLVFLSARDVDGQP
jgi:hypothetical protein